MDGMFYLIRTALHEAASTNSIDVLHYLIYKGADLSLLTTDNKAAKDIAADQNYDQTQLDQMFSIYKLIR
jgi:ankyrin repeat protein